jgi:hypothetical protein
MSHYLLLCMHQKITHININVYVSYVEVGSDSSC